MVLYSKALTVFRCRTAGHEAAEAERGIRGGLTLAGGSAVDTVALDEAHEDDLGEDDCDDGLGVDEAGVAQVVQAASLEDLCASLPPAPSPLLSILIWPVDHE